MKLPSLQTSEDLFLLRETCTLECKLAGGKDGAGSLPEDFWPSYSAFANTNGGVVVLGVREKKGIFTVAGISDPHKIRAELFSGLNNRKKVSVNLLTDDDITEVSIDGQLIMVIEVPRALRHQRPVYLTQNPMAGNSYVRLNESDCSLSDEAVKRMLAEQVEDSRDDRILSNYNIHDLNVSGKLMPFRVCSSRA